MTTRIRVNAATHTKGLALGAVVSHLRELREHAPLVAALVRHELKARYRSSVLGYLWTLLNPAMLLLIYSLVFSIYLRIDVEQYALFLFTALLPWIWTSQSLTAATKSIIGGAAMITRATLPPQLLPLNHVLTNLANMLLALPVLVAAATLSGRPPSLAIAALPLLFLAQLLFTYGLAVVLAALCVRFRDIEFLVTNLVTFWFFLTPIIYPIKVVPEEMRALLLVNPMVPFVLSYQAIFYEQRFPDPIHVGLALAVGAAALYAGIWLFERMRDTLAEEI